jgi:hypothetical protein
LSAIQRCDKCERETCVHIVQELIKAQLRTVAPQARAMICLIVIAQLEEENELQKKEQGK